MSCLYGNKASVGWHGLLFNWTNYRESLWLTLSRYIYIDETLASHTLIQSQNGINWQRKVLDVWIRGWLCKPRCYWALAGAFDGKVWHLAVCVFISQASVLYVGCIQFCSWCWVVLEEYTVKLLLEKSWGNVFGSIQISQYKVSGYKVTSVASVILCMHYFNEVTEIPNWFKLKFFMSFLWD